VKIQEEIHMALKEIDHKLRSNIDLSLKSESILLLTALLEEESIHEE
jgi:hypothetical protein